MVTLDAAKEAIAIVVVPKRTVHMQRDYVDDLSVHDS
jgi:hypothetical protein